MYKIKKVNSLLVIYTYLILYRIHFRSEYEIVYVYQYSSKKKRTVENISCGVELGLNVLILPIETLQIIGLMKHLKSFKN